MTIRNSWKRVIAGMLAVLVVAGTVSGDLGINGLFSGNSTSITAQAAEATTLTADTTTWENGDYVVPEGGLTISGHITVNGTVNLTLPAGTTLTANKGITISDGATLNVSGEGEMTVNGSKENTTSTVAGNGTLVLTSGTLTAKGGKGETVQLGSSYTGRNGGAAINGSVIVNGGTLTATGGNGGTVQSFDCTGGNGGPAITGSVTVDGGTATLTRGSNGNHIWGRAAGTGGASYSGTLNIGNGLIVKAGDNADNAVTVTDYTTVNTQAYVKIDTPEVTTTQPLVIKAGDKFKVGANVPSTFIANDQIIRVPANTVYKVTEGENGLVVKVMGYQGNDNSLSEITLNLPYSVDSAKTYLVEVKMVNNTLRLAFTENKVYKDSVFQYSIGDVFTKSATIRFYNATVNIDGETKNSVTGQKKSMEV